MRPIYTIEEIKNDEDDYVSVSGKTITLSEIHKLIEALKSNHVLKNLTIHAFPYDNYEQMSELFKILQNHPTLEKLTIATYTPLTLDNIEALKKLITSPTTKLKELSLDNKASTDQGLAMLLPAIISSPSLTRFVYFIPDATNNTIMAAATTLINESKLQAIYFFPQEPECDITCNQIKALVNALRQNTTLKVLCLSLDTYQPQALQPLFDHLETNHSLDELALYSINEIETLQALVKAMKQNKQINFLSIEIKPTIKNIKLMLDLVNHNSTLTRLDFCSMGDPLGDPDEIKKIEDQINNKLENNKIMLQTNSTTDKSQQSRKRSAYQTVLTSSDPGSHNKRQRPSRDENTSRNTQPSSEGPPSPTTIHI